MLTLLQFRLINVPQLVHTGRLTSRNTFSKLDDSTNSCAPANCILCGNGFDLDDADSRIVRASIVLAVAKITDPCLESRAIEFVYLLAIRLYGRFAGNGCPLSSRVQERQIDLGI